MKNEVRHRQSITVHCNNVLYTKNFLVTGAMLIDLGDILKLIESDFPDQTVNLREWARHLRQCRYRHCDLLGNWCKRLDRFLCFRIDLVEALRACA